MNATPIPSGQSVEILIAEDSPTQAQRLQHILEQQGYHVTHAANGRLALEAARRLPPTLIISDVVMPEMDGYELCRRVKSEPGLSDTPVILVTTLSDPQDVIRGLECRADNFILKPYDESHLLGRVQFVLINRHVRQTERAGMGVDIFFNGHKHFITADRLQILNLLLSTYEAAMQRNKELTLAKDELHLLNMNLEVANNELEAFSYSVSHDLRAPLRHISGYIHSLTLSDNPARPEKDRENLAHIANSAKRMTRLIDDLLEFCRMGRSEMRHSPLNPNTMLEEVLRQLQPETVSRNIIWKKNPLPEIQADPALFRQVLANLIFNAVKYSRPRNPAEIEIGCLEESPHEIVMFVRDNGVGFDMKYAHKLFGVFQRLHRQEDFEGTGVGLANVRRIISRHGGRTWAEGTIDGGATFYFSLPKNAAVPSE